MNLALIIDDYLPESTRVGAKMFHELALEFIKRGHHVTVITPKAEQHEDLVMDSLDGVAVWRFKNGPIKDVSYLTRGVNETLLSLRAWKAVRHLIKANTFDGIVYYSPSVFLGWLGQKNQTTLSMQVLFGIARHVSSVGNRRGHDKKWLSD